MEETKKKMSGYDDKQIMDARQFSGALQNVPKERRGNFIALANAYMDGMAAGAALASGNK